MRFFVLSFSLVPDGMWVQVGPGEDFWIVGVLGPCWVCGQKTKWAYLDVGFQHLDCEAYPSPEGNIRIVRGLKRVEP